MKKVNTRNIAEESSESPKRKFAWFSKGVSEALGRNPRSTDLNERHPFDVEILRINSSIQAIKTWSSTSSRTIRSARLFIITTARNGRSGHQSGGCFVVNR